MDIIKKDILLLKTYPHILTDVKNTMEKQIDGLTSGIIEPWELYDYFVATLQENNIIIK